MPLLDELLNIRPSERDWVRRVDFVLRTEPDIYSGYFDHYASDLGIDPEMITRSTATPPLGVHSVGIMATDSGWAPALLVMRDLAPGTQFAEPAPAARYPSLRDFVTRVGDIDPSNIGVIGIDPPQEQYEAVHGDLIGTLGLPIRLADGSRGALTAGHVARQIGSSVWLGNGIIGNVTHSDYRARYTGGTPCADVAAIRLEDDWRTHTKVPKGLVIETTKELKSLRPINRSGIGREGGIVRFAGDKFFVNETEGSWGDFIFVDPISIEGDSGSLALADDRRIVGQVVGGLSGAYSIVQNIAYLTSSAQVEPEL